MRAPPRKGPTEKQVVARVWRLYKAVGCTIYSTQQFRPSRQAIGLPDLYVVHQRGGAWWHEAKRPGGKQSDGQRLFQYVVERAGVGYVLGGADEARAELERRGILKDGFTTDLSAFAPLSPVKADP